MAECLLVATCTCANHQNEEKTLIETVQKLWKKKSEPSWGLNPGPSDY